MEYNIQYYMRENRTRLWGGGRSGLLMEWRARYNNNNDNNNNSASVLLFRQYNNNNNNNVRIFCIFGRTRGVRDKIRTPIFHCIKLEYRCADIIVVVLRERRVHFQGFGILCMLIRRSGVHTTTDIRYVCVCVCVRYWER